MTGTTLATQVFQFGISIAMARLLAPSAFGLVAVVYSVGAFAQIFTDLGLTAAVVQAKRVTEELLSSAFWLNFWTGVACTVLVSLLAFPLARIYGQPRLVGLFVLVSFGFTLSCGGVHQALLERSFNFRRIAIIELASNIIGFAAMPCAAIAGLGVYSLVIGPLLSTGLLSLFLWLNVRWWPRSGMNRAAVRGLWRFSRGLVGFSAINFWSRNLDNLLLGATVSPAQLGDYSRSYSLMMVPVGQTSGVLMRVLYPALSRMQEEPARLGRAWTRAMAVATGSITLPITLTVAATAPALVEVLYGPRWRGMVPVLELLSIAAVPQIISAGGGAPYQAVGRTGLLFRVGVVGALGFAVAIVVALPWGVIGVSVAILAASWLLVPVAIGPLAKIFGVSLVQLLWGIISGWGGALAVACCELAVRLLVSPAVPRWQELALQLFAGGLAYLLLMWRSESEFALAAKGTFSRFARRRRTT